MTKANTAITYKSNFRKYLEYLNGDDPTKANLAAFLDSLKNSGFTPGSVRLYYYGIVQSLKQFGITLRLDEPPQCNRLDAQQPYFDDEEIEALIKSAKDLGGLYVTTMALSTTYGLRRVEIANLKAADFNPEKRTLFIHTAKHGRPATHAVPDQIFKYIQLPDKMPGVVTMSRMFNQVARKANIRKDRSGWHSIRRSVVTGLRINGVTGDDVRCFMRWAEGGMLAIYHFRSPKEDFAVFKNHPFLPYWEESTHV